MDAPSFCVNFEVSGEGGVDQTRSGTAVRQETGLASW
jgi:hypothetical protein